VTTRRTRPGATGPESARNRAGRRRTTRAETQELRKRPPRRHWLRRPGRLALVVGSGLGAIVLVVALTVAISPAGGLPGMQAGPPPWSANATQLRARLASIGLVPKRMEGEVLHTHEHLDLFVDGRPVTVPANIGINTTQGFLSPLHTHDASGIIHVESPVLAIFTLGQVFDVWGVALSRSCLGGACQPAGEPLAAFVNGHSYGGNPRDIVLAAHEEICICVGSLPSSIPSSYAFPPGL
jgi:hypothetical protein